MRTPKSFETTSGEQAVTVRAETNILVEHWESAQIIAHELGYTSLKEYLDAHLGNLVYWTLTRDHEERNKKYV